MENSFEKAAKIVLYVLTALLPIWFMPLPINVETGREITFGVLIILAAILWLLSILTTGKFRFHLSPVLYAAALLLMVETISTFFSKAPVVSAYLADPIGERLSTIVLGVVLMILVSGLFRRQKDAGTMIFVLIFAGAISAIINFAQLVSGLPFYQKIISYASGNDFNAIGTQNGLALFYGALLAMSLGILTSLSIKKWKSWIKYSLIISILAFVANLLVINFQTAWIIVLGVSIFLFGLVSKNTLRRGDEPRKFDWRNWLSILFLVLSVVMLLIKTPILKNLNFPTEISPSFRATLDIGLQVFKEGAKPMFFGSGPGTFGLDWSKYKDPAINQTVFWSLRFNQGSSWLSTLVPTAGVLGALAFVMFILCCLFSFLKQLFIPESREEDSTISNSLFLGFISLVLIAVIYPANFSLILVFFLVVGLISAHLSSPAREEKLTEDEEKDFWSIEEKTISLASPWSVFLSSLFIIFLISIGITGLYMEFGRVRSVLAFQQGVNYLNAGDIDKAIDQLDKMTSYDDSNFRNYQTLVQIRIEKIKDLVQKASNGQNVQQDFQSTVATAIQNSQKAIQLFPAEPSLWETQGSLYELIIPFIQGSEKFAFDSYRQSAALDPFNPVIWVDLGRSGLVFGDRLKSLEAQASATDKDQLEKLRTTVLEESEKALQKSVEIKPDYAPGHFLLAQTALRLGNIASAIKSTEDAKLAAPFDIGVAFQLGLLYYQNNSLDQARAEFERAVSINPNYSNARYFLGLVYDKQGNKTKAIEQFQNVLALNPDNQEIKTILDNLQKGKSSLAGIVPPGTPPEKRTTTPVQEKNKK